MSSTGFAERTSDDGAGDAAVRGDGERVAGVVVDPAQDLHMGSVGEPPVGEVGLPAFVGQIGGKADVGSFGRFLGAGVTKPAARRCRMIDGVDTVKPWWWSRCQAIVSGPLSSPLLVSFSRSSTIRSMLDCGSRVGLVCGRRER